MNELVLETTPVAIIMPKQHLGLIIANYAFQTGAIDKSHKIESMSIPVETDEEGNITITVGLIKEQVN